MSHSLTAFVKGKSAVTSKEIRSAGFTYTALSHARQDGRLERIRKGIYAIADAEITGNENIVQAAKVIPQGVCCLISALAIHNLTTQIPNELWLAVPRGISTKNRMPFAIHYISLIPEVYQFGIETHQVDGTAIKVYSVAKTVIDCFKFRNKIGLDVAIEALSDAKKKNLVTNDQLWQAAKVCRMTRIIQPYLEAIS